jgi:peptidoglycan pentaglycine glycine transferase (the first glycine)
MSIVEPHDWELFLKNYPDVHILQTVAWGQLKSTFGWRAYQVINGEIGAQILFRTLPGGFSFAYIPKGPIFPEAGVDFREAIIPIEGISSQRWSNFWAEIDDFCRRNRAVFLKIEPDIWETTENSVRDSPPEGFRFSEHAIQPTRTILLNVSENEEKILSRMKQKTRYNIRLASKKGVSIHTSQDFDVFHQLMLKTGGRDQFSVHNLHYYQTAYEIFNPLQECELYIAYYGHEILAGLMVFRHGERAWFFYGGSSDLKREFMASYALQWEAIRWARSKGCIQYDLWGIPDYDENKLENSFTDRADGLWGVYRFKRGFGGEVKRCLGPWDRVYNQPLYTFYRLWMHRKNS